MSKQPNKLSRRKALAGIGISGIVLTQHALSQETPVNTTNTITRYATVQAMKSATEIREGEWAETAGFYTPGDGGAALYHIKKTDANSQPT